MSYSPFENASNRTKVVEGDFQVGDEISDYEITGFGRSWTQSERSGLLVRSKDGWVSADGKTICYAYLQELPQRKEQK